MNAEKIKIIDSCGCVVATAQVSERGDRFSGQAELNAMPPGLRRKFEEYEEIVNGQVFGLLDEIEDQIQSLPLKVLFENDSEAAFEDLQLYPSSGRISFRVAKNVARA